MGFTWIKDKSGRKDVWELYINGGYPTGELRGVIHKTYSGRYNAQIIFGKHITEFADEFNSFAIAKKVIQDELGLK